jgi:hypothetical protein
LPYYGDIVAIVIFNKTLSDSARESVENYFKVKVIDKYPVSSVTQLDYVVYHIRDNGQQIFGGDLVGGKLLYSINGGASFTELEFADIANMQMGHIFPNGNIFFCTKTHVYKSIDNLGSVVGVQAQKPDGTNFNPSADDNYEPIHKVDEQVLENGDVMIVWGNYSLSGISYIYRSINGENCRIAYRFGALYDYTARHTHSVAFCSDNGYWYVNTGDDSDDHEVHFIRGKYEDSTWSWEYLLEGSDAERTKAAGVTFFNGKIYWASDATTSPAATELGVFLSDIDTFTTLASHETVFNLPTEAGSMCVDNNNIVVLKNRDANTEYLYVYEINTKKLSVYVFNITYNGLYKILKSNTNQYILTARGNEYNSYKLVL